MDTDQLLQSAAAGDATAADAVLERHRERLRNMVAIRLNPQLLPRLDASDVVQDVMVTAHQRFAAYLQDRPIAFYPWLRRIAINRLADLYRHHVQTEKRSPHREVAAPSHLSDESAELLIHQLADAKQDSPSRQLMNEELKVRLRNALRRLPEPQREIIVMRHLERLSVKEIADIMGIPAGSVMSRHFRGLRTLRRLLDD